MKLMIVQHDDLLRRYYAEQIALHDMIGIVLTQSPEYVAPHGSTEAVFGTNPIAIGIPSHDAAPLVTDMASSAVAWYDLVEAQAAGVAISPDTGFNSAGEPTTNPADVLQGGALQVFDRSVTWFLLVEVAFISSDCTH